MANLQTFPIRATFCSKLFDEKKIFCYNTKILYLCSLKKPIPYVVPDEGYLLDTVGFFI